MTQPVRSLSLSWPVDRNYSRAEVTKNNSVSNPNEYIPITLMRLDEVNTTPVDSLIINDATDVLYVDLNEYHVASGKYTITLTFNTSSQQIDYSLARNFLTFGSYARGQEFAGITVGTNPDLPEGQKNIPVLGFVGDVMVKGVPFNTELPGLQPNTSYVLKLVYNPFDNLETHKITLFLDDELYCTLGNIPGDYSSFDFSIPNKKLFMGTTGWTTEKSWTGRLDYNPFSISALEFASKKNKFPQRYIQQHRPNITPSNIETFAINTSRYNGENATGHLPLVSSKASSKIEIQFKSDSPSNNRKIVLYDETDPNNVKSIVLRQVGLSRTGRKFVMRGDFNDSTFKNITKIQAELDDQVFDLPTNLISFNIKNEDDKPTGFDMIPTSTENGILTLQFKSLTDSAIKSGTNIPANTFINPLLLQNGQSNGRLVGQDRQVGTFYKITVFAVNVENQTFNPAVNSFDPEQPDIYQSATEFYINVRNKRIYNIVNGQKETLNQGKILLTELNIVDFFGIYAFVEDPVGNVSDLFAIRSSENPIFLGDNDPAEISELINVAQGVNSAGDVGINISGWAYDLQSSYNIYNLISTVQINHNDPSLFVNLINLYGDSFIERENLENTTPQDGVFNITDSQVTKYYDGNDFSNDLVPEKAYYVYVVVRDNSRNTAPAISYYRNNGSTTPKTLSLTQEYVSTEALTSNVNNQLDKQIAIVGDTVTLKLNTLFKTDLSNISLVVNNESPVTTNFVLSETQKEISYVYTVADTTNSGLITFQFKRNNVDLTPTTIINKVFVQKEVILDDSWQVYPETGGDNFVHKTLYVRGPASQNSFIHTILSSSVLNSTNFDVKYGYPFQIDLKLLEQGTTTVLSTTTLENIVYDKDSSEFSNSTNDNLHIISFGDLSESTNYDIQLVITTASGLTNNASPLSRTASTGVDFPVITSSPNITIGSISSVEADNGLANLHLASVSVSDKSSRVSLYTQCFKFEHNDLDFLEELYVTNGKGIQLLNNQLTTSPFEQTDLQYDTFLDQVNVLDHNGISKNFFPHNSLDYYINLFAIDEHGNKSVHNIRKTFNYSFENKQVKTSNIKNVTYFKNDDTITLTWSSTRHIDNTFNAFTVEICGSPIDVAVENYLPEGLTIDSEKYFYHRLVLTGFTIPSTWDSHLLGVSIVFNFTGETLSGFNSIYIDITEPITNSLSLNRNILESTNGISYFFNKIRIHNIEFRSQEEKNKLTNDYNDYKFIGTIKDINGNVINQVIFDYTDVNYSEPKIVPTIIEFNNLTNNTEYIVDLSVEDAVGNTYTTNSLQVSTFPNVQPQYIINSQLSQRDRQYIVNVTANDTQAATNAYLLISDNINLITDPQSTDINPINFSAIENLLSTSAGSEANIFVRTAANIGDNMTFENVTFTKYYDSVNNTFQEIQTGVNYYLGIVFIPINSSLELILGQNTSYFPHNLEVINQQVSNIIVKVNDQLDYPFARYSVENSDVINIEFTLLHSELNVNRYKVLIEDIDTNNLQVSLSDLSTTDNFVFQSTHTLNEEDTNGIKSIYLYEPSTTQKIPLSLSALTYQRDLSIGSLPVFNFDNTTITIQNASADLGVSYLKDILPSTENPFIYEQADNAFDLRIELTTSIGNISISSPPESTTHNITVTVGLNDSGSNQYSFSPPISEFVNGDIYIFDNSQNVSAHPLNFHNTTDRGSYLFSQDSNGFLTLDNFSEYTVLFAHCSYHSNMSSDVNGITGIPIVDNVASQTTGETSPNSVVFELNGITYDLTTSSFVYNTDQSQIVSHTFTSLLQGKTYTPIITVTLQNGFLIGTRQDSQITLPANYPVINNFQIVQATQNNQLSFNVNMNVIDTIEIYSVYTVIVSVDQNVPLFTNNEIIQLVNSKIDTASTDAIYREIDIAANQQTLVNTNIIKYFYKPTANEDWVEDFIVPGKDYYVYTVVNNASNLVTIDYRTDVVRVETIIDEVSLNGIIYPNGLDQPQNATRLGENYFIATLVSNNRSKVTFNMRTKYAVQPEQINMTFMGVSNVELTTTDNRNFTVTSEIPDGVSDGLIPFQVNIFDTFSFTQDDVTFTTSVFLRNQPPVFTYEINRVMITNISVPFYKLNINENVAHGQYKIQFTVTDLTSKQITSPIFDIPSNLNENTQFAITGLDADQTYTVTAKVTSPLGLVTPDTSPVTQSFQMADGVAPVFLNEPIITPYHNLITFHNLRVYDRIHNVNLFTGCFEGHQITESDMQEFIQNNFENNSFQNSIQTLSEITNHTRAEAENNDLPIINFTHAVKSDFSSELPIGSNLPYSVYYFARDTSETQFSPSNLALGTSINKTTPIPPEEIVPNGIIVLEEPTTTTDVVINNDPAHGETLSFTTPQAVAEYQNPVPDTSDTFGVQMSVEYESDGFTNNNVEFVTLMEQSPDHYIRLHNDNTLMIRWGDNGAVQELITIPFPLSPGEVNDINIQFSTETNTVTAIINGNVYETSYPPVLSPATSLIVGNNSVGTAGIGNVTGLVLGNVSVSDTPIPQSVILSRFAARGKVMEYTFDDSSGLYVNSVTNIIATLNKVNNVEHTEKARIGSGAMLLPTNADYVHNEDIDIAEIHANNATICMWYYHVHAGVSNNEFIKLTTPNNESLTLKLKNIEGVMYMSCEFVDSSAVLFNTLSQPLENIRNKAWNSISFVMKETSVEFYLNSVFVGSSIESSQNSHVQFPQSSFFKSIKVGGGSETANNTIIDHLVIYNIAVNQNTVKNVFETALQKQLLVRYNFERTQAIANSTNYKVYDESIYGGNGLLYNVDATVTSTVNVPIQRHALDLEGVSEYVEISPTNNEHTMSNLDASNFDECTISAWVNMSGAPDKTYYPILTKNNNFRFGVEFIENSDTQTQEGIVKLEIGNDNLGFVPNPSVSKHVNNVSLFEDSPVASYRFKEGTTDSITQRFDGVLSSTDAPIISDGIIPYKGTTINSAFNFTGSNNIDLGNVVDTTATDEFTLSAWVKVSESNMQNNHFSIISQDQTLDMSLKYGELCLDLNTSGVIGENVSATLSGVVQSVTYSDTSKSLFYSGQVVSSELSNTKCFAIALTQKHHDAEYVRTLINDTRFVDVYDSFLVAKDATFAVNNRPLQNVIDSSLQIVRANTVEKAYVYLYVEDDFGNVDVSRNVSEDLVDGVYMRFMHNVAGNEIKFYGTLSSDIEFYKVYRPVVFLNENITETEAVNFVNNNSVPFENEVYNKDTVYYFNYTITTVVDNTNTVVAFNPSTHTSFVIKWVVVDIRQTVVSDPSTKNSVNILSLEEDIRTYGYSKGAYTPLTALTQTMNDTGNYQIVCALSLSKFDPPANHIYIHNFRIKLETSIDGGNTWTMLDIDANEETKKAFHYNDTTGNIHDRNKGTDQELVILYRNVHPSTLIRPTILMINTTHSNWGVEWSGVIHKDLSSLSIMKYPDSVKMIDMWKHAGKNNTNVHPITNPFKLAFTANDAVTGHIEANTQTNNGRVDGSSDTFEVNNGALNFKETGTYLILTNATFRNAPSQTNGHGWDGNLVLIKNDSTSPTQIEKSIRYSRTGNIGLQTFANFSSIFVENFAQNDTLTVGAYTTYNAGYAGYFEANAMNTIAIKLDEPETFESYAEFITLADQDVVSYDIGAPNHLIWNMTTGVSIADSFVVGGDGNAHNIVFNDEGYYTLYINLSGTIDNGRDPKVMYVYVNNNKVESTRVENCRQDAVNMTKIVSDLYIESGSVVSVGVYLEDYNGSGPFVFTVLQNSTFVVVKHAIAREQPSISDFTPYTSEREALDITRSSTFSVISQNAAYGSDLVVDGPSSRLSDLVSTPAGTSYSTSHSASPLISGGYQQPLPNGDIIHSSSTYLSNRPAVALFDNITNNWNNAWHGDSGTTTMYAIYEFASSKSVSSMDFGQVPGNLHYAGYIHISYWNGTEFVEVNYTNDNRFVNATYSEVITITFDSVLSDKFHIRVESGPNNNTVHVGLSEWTIYGVTPKQRLSDLVDTPIGTVYYSEVFASNRISGGYQQSLPNGDIVHSSNTHQTTRTAVSLFDTHTTNWENAWHGPAGVTTMYAIYEFANGESKAVSSMSFGQVPSANHYAGDIYIYYWDGTDFVVVNYTSDNKFTSNTFGETITITFDEVISNRFEITVLNNHPNNNTNIVGLSEWTIYGSAGSPSAVANALNEVFDETELSQAWVSLSSEAKLWAWVDLGEEYEIAHLDLWQHAGDFDRMVSDFKLHLTNDLTLTTSELPEGQENYKFSNQQATTTWNYTSSGTYLPGTHLGGVNDNTIGLEKTLDSGFHRFELLNVEPTSRRGRYLYFEPIAHATGVTPIINEFKVYGYYASDAPRNFVPSEIYSSDNTSLETVVITGALFDRTAKTDPRQQLGQVTLPNGDKFYSPRELALSGPYISPGVFINNAFSDVQNLRPSNTGVIPLKTSYEFYYEPARLKRVNRCVVYMNDQTATSHNDYIESIGVVNGIRVTEVTNPTEALPFFIDTTNYTGEGNGKVIDFDTVTIGPENPIKLVLAQNNDSMLIAEVQFDYIDETIAFKRGLGVDETNIKAFMTFDDLDNGTELTTIPDKGDGTEYSSRFGQGTIVTDNLGYKSLSPTTAIAWQPTAFKTPASGSWTFACVVRFNPADPYGRLTYGINRDTSNVDQRFDMEYDLLAGRMNFIKNGARIPMFHNLPEIGEANKVLVYISCNGTDNFYVEIKYVEAVSTNVRNEIFNEGSTIPGNTEFALGNTHENGSPQASIYSVMFVNGVHATSTVNTSVRDSVVNYFTNKYDLLYVDPDALRYVQLLQTMGTNPQDVTAFIDFEDRTVGESLTSIDDRGSQYSTRSGEGSIAKDSVGVKYLIPTKAIGWTPTAFTTPTTANTSWTFVSVIKVLHVEDRFTFAMDPNNKPFNIDPRPLEDKLHFWDIGLNILTGLTNWSNAKNAIIYVSSNGTSETFIRVLYRESIENNSTIIDKSTTSGNLIDPGTQFAIGGHAINLPGGTYLYSTMFINNAYATLTTNATQHDNIMNHFIEQYQVLYQLPPEVPTEQVYGTRTVDVSAYTDETVVSSVNTQTLKDSNVMIINQKVTDASSVERNALYAYGVDGTYLTHIVLDSQAYYGGSTHKISGNIFAYRKSNTTLSFFKLGDDYLSITFLYDLVINNTTVNGESMGADVRIVELPQDNYIGLFNKISNTSYKYILLQVSETEATNVDVINGTINQYISGAFALGNMGVVVHASRGDDAPTHYMHFYTFNTTTNTFNGVVSDTRGFGGGAYYADHSIFNMPKNNLIVMRLGGYSHARGVYVRSLYYYDTDTGSLITTQGTNRTNLMGIYQGAFVNETADGHLLLNYNQNFITIKVDKANSSASVLNLSGVYFNASKPNSKSLIVDTLDDSQMIYVSRDDAVNTYALTFDYVETTNLTRVAPTAPSGVSAPTRLRTNLLIFSNSNLYYITSIANPKFEHGYFYYQSQNEVFTTPSMTFTVPTRVYVLTSTDMPSINSQWALYEDGSKILGGDDIYSATHTSVKTYYADFDAGTHSFGVQLYKWGMVI